MRRRVRETTTHKGMNGKERVCVCVQWGQMKSGLVGSKAMGARTRAVSAQKDCCCLPPLKPLLSLPSSTLHSPPPQKIAKQNTHTTHTPYIYRQAIVAVQESAHDLEEQPAARALLRPVDGLVLEHAADDGGLELVDEVAALRLKRREQCLCLRRGRGDVSADVGRRARRSRGTPRRASSWRRRLSTQRR